MFGYLGHDHIKGADYKSSYLPVPTYLYLWNGYSYKLHIWHADNY